jgi:hypothetical protein
MVKIQEIKMNNMMIRFYMIGLSIFAAIAVTMKAESALINGVNYNENGVSETVWSDDGSYGIKIDNKLDINGNIRIFEYAKVNDSNFTRDSFTLNTDYTFSLLNEVLVNSGVASDENSAKNLFSDYLNPAGTLDAGNGWMLVDNGNGSHNVDHIPGREGDDFVVPTLGDYAVRERTLDANNIANNSSAYIDNNILFNNQGQFYGQIKFDASGNGVNLAQLSENGLDFLESNGVSGSGIQAVPEPTTMSLIGLIGAGLLVGRRLYGKR